MAACGTTSEPTELPTPSTTGPDHWPAPSTERDANSCSATTAGTVGLLVDADLLRADGPRRVGTRLAAALREAVRTGRLVAGARLPASRVLASELGVSRGVVVRAYEQLVAEGYLVAEVGSGTRVGATWAASPTPAIPLPAFEPTSPGQPDTGLFPRARWARALDEATRSATNGDLRYGDPRGHRRLREALVEHLGRTRAVLASPDQVVVTAGYGQAVRLAGDVLAGHTGLDTIAIEDPGSIGVVATLAAAGLRDVPVPVDDGGIDVDLLEQGDARAVLVTPAHQFPTGAVLASDRRSALLEWADRTGGLVVEDDYDAELRYDRAPVGALQGLAPDLVLHGGSVSKSLAPGLRLGWLVVPHRLVRAVVDARRWHDVTPPTLPQLALASLLGDGSLVAHVRRAGTTYARRRQALLDAVDADLPGWSVSGVDAGLHAVLTPPDGHPVALHVLDAAARSSSDVGVVALHRYCRGPARRGLVIGFGDRTEQRLRDAVARLAEHVFG